MIKKKRKKKLRIGTSSAFQINQKLLEDFYIKVYSYRSNRLENFWKWIYRTEFLLKKNPVVTKINNEVVGHMGLIPFFLNLNGKKIKAAWYADMHVLPKYRGRGIAKKITEKLMKLVDVHLSFGNDQSMNIFNKYGWVKTYNTNLHYIFLEPMNHPKLQILSNYFNLIFKLLNLIYKNFFYIYYVLKQDKKNKTQILDLNEKNIKIFYDYKSSKSLVSTIIDKNYLKWRFLKSPDNKKYIIFKTQDNYAALVKKRKDKPRSPHLDILLFNKFTNHNKICTLINDIVIWSKKNNYSYLRVYISDKRLSNKIKFNLLSVVKHPRFAFYSSNKKYMKLLMKMKFKWQLADSDFEFIS